MSCGLGSSCASTVGPARLEAYFAGVGARDGGAHAEARIAIG